MKPYRAKATLEGEIVSLEKQTSLRFAIISVLFFVIFGTLAEQLLSMLIDKISFQQVLREFRWSKLFFSAGFYSFFWYIVFVRKQKKLLQQKKAELQTASI